MKDSWQRWGGALLAVALTSGAAAVPLLQQQTQLQPQQQPPKDQSKQTQQQSQPQPQAKPSDTKQPAPLFGGSLNLKSSQKSKDTATLGFNGLDPNGQVEKSVLASSPTDADQKKAEQVAGYKVDSNELQAFIAEGKLKK